MEHPITKRAIFLRSLAMSASTIGGGFVILAVMRRIYAEKLNWLTEEELLDIASAAQSAPGAVAVNASLLLGYHLSGVGGAVVSVLGTLIPPLIIMAVLAALYRGIRSAAWIGKLLLGMQAGVSAVILDTALTMTGITLRKGTDPRSGRTLRILLFAASLVFSIFTGIHSAFLILGASVIGVCACGIGRFIGRKAKEERK